MLEKEVIKVLEYKINVFQELKSLEMCIRDRFYTV